MMAKRPTMRDVAKLAGVGVATVDRVLNGRHPVRAATSERVLASAEQLGYHAAALIRHRIASTLPVRRFGFLLQKQSDVFYQNLAIELQAETLNARDIHGSAKVVHVDELAPGTIASAMKELGSKVDAVACVAVDHPLVTNAVEELHEKGVPVIALLTPLSAASISGYIGLDNRKLGRTAAWLMARLVVTTGKVGLFVGSHRYIGHELTEGGFRSYFR
ncbi:MAG: LacI family DNA-binding transcriptional regulator, partial [Paracoccaceae bacterium]